MLKRVLLYTTKNFLKMVSTLIMFTVMLSLIGTLVYVYSTINNRVDETGLIRRNYIIDYEKIYGPDGTASGDVKSYSLIYDELRSLEGLESYKVDFGYTSTYNFATEQLNLSESKVISFQIADDLKQIDFVTGAVEVVSGELSSTGIMISEDEAEELGVAVGDTVELSTYNLLDSDIDFTSDTIDASYQYVYEVEVTGIYAKKTENENSMVADSFYNVYLSKDTYDEISKNIKSKEFEYIPEMAEYSMGQPDFERVLAQYDNKESAEKLDKFVEDNYDEVYIVDSAETIDKSVEPLTDFNRVIALITIVVIFVSAVGIYLNMFLKLEKRRSEFIALLGCGINSFKLSIQVFLEQLLFVIIAIPFSYLFVKSLVDMVIEIIKKYYIVLIDEIAMSGDTFYGDWLEYVTVDSANIVDFTNANLLIVISVTVAIIFLSLFVLCLVEVNRRYKSIKKV